MNPSATYATTADHHVPKRGFKADFVPVYVVVGMIALSATFGLYTAKHQMMYSPDVRVKKKHRETLPEVEDPDKVVGDAEKYLKKSFFRKVAHVQDSGYGDNIRDPVRKDAFAYKPKADTFKSSS